MSRAIVTIGSNPKDASVEDRYNEWYSGAHLADIRALPGVVRAERYRVSAAQVIPADHPHRYLTVVELEVDDVQTAVGDMLGMAATDPVAAEVMELDPLPAVTVFEAL